MNITEVSEAAITVRGTYFPPGKSQYALGALVHCMICLLVNSLISNITLQILLSYCHTLLIAKTGRIS